jgi:hypothetical protein
VSVDHLPDTDSKAEVKPMAPPTNRIPPLGYFRSVWTLFWTAFRHPFTTTAIDLSTGQIVSGEPDDGQATASDHLVEPGI